MARNLKVDDVATAAARMRSSSDLFRELRYQSDLAAGGEIVARIADLELDALRHMENGWDAVRSIDSAPPVREVRPQAAA